MRVYICFLYRMWELNPKKATNSTIDEFAYTGDADQTAHNEQSHLDLQSLSFQHNAVYIENFTQYCRRDFVVCLFGVFWVKTSFFIYLFLNH